MCADKNKIQRQIENVDLCIWLLSRYNDDTATNLIEEYCSKKDELEKLYRASPDKKK